MRQFKKCNLIQKTIVLLAVFLIICSSVIVKPVYADGPTEEDLQEGSGGFLENAGGILFEPIASLLCGVGDTVNKILQKMIIGTPFSEEIIVDTDVNDVFEENSVTKFVETHQPVEGKGITTKYIVKDNIDSITGTYIIPNFSLTPAEIFSGNVSALDANFFKTNTEYDEELGGESKSTVSKLTGVVSQWYVALRNIAIVGLLSVLLYLGIRIVISSNAGDKAKYKQIFVDWVVALCLIFFLHYIMAFIMTMSETITQVLSGNISESGTIKQVNIEYVNKDGTPYEDTEHQLLFVSWGESHPIYFSSNFTGLARIKAEYKDVMSKMGYSIIYLALTVYTVYFTFIYLKRLLYLAFFTMIAPLVALAYPLDKIKDGKAQAFNFWFKEYTFYALLQPLHLLLYTVFVTSALELASDNMIYAIVALAFIVPAEKIVKQMFGIKGQTESSLGGFAGGALASQAFNALKSKTASGNKGGAQNANNNKIRQAKNPNAPDGMQTLAGDAMGLDQAAIAEGATATIGAAAGAAAMHDDNVDTREQPASDQGNALDEQAVARALAEQQRNAQSPQNAIDGNVAQNNNDNPQLQQPNPPVQTAETDKIKEFKRKLKATQSNFGKAVKRRYVAAGGGKAIAKKVAMGAAKGYVRAAGTVALGAAGLGMGIVGGDLKDTMTGLTAGVAAGSVVSKRANKAISNTVSGNNALGRLVGESWHGDDYGRQQVINQHMDDPEARERVMDGILAKTPNIKVGDLNRQVSQQLEAEGQMMYDTGISDQKDIAAAVKLENETLRGQVSDPHAMAVALAKLGQNYDKSTFTDKNKFEQAQKALQKRLEEQMKKNIENQIDQQLSTANMSDTERATERQRRIAEQSANVSQQANAEATQTLERIRKMKKL